MTLSLPSYIKAAHLAQPPNYKWPKEGGCTMFDEKENPRTAGAIWFTTYRARFTLHIAITEWIVSRFEGTSVNYELAWHFLEAMWACSVDEHYLHQDPSTRGKMIQTGSVDEPVYAAIIQLILARSALYRHNTSRYVHPSCYLAVHVLPDKKPFSKWLKAALSRISKHHYTKTANSNITPTKEEIAMPEGDERRERSGRPIPRIAFDPEHDYDPANNPAHIDKFLRGLDHASNPYLASPEHMIKQGFAGTPYTYTPKV